MNLQTFLQLNNAFGTEADLRQQQALANLQAQQQQNAFNDRTADDRAAMLGAQLQNVLAGTDATRSQTNIAETRAPIVNEQILSQIAASQGNQQRANELHPLQLEQLGLQNQIHQNSIDNHPQQQVLLGQHIKNMQTSDMVSRANTAAMLDEANINAQSNRQIAPSMLAPLLNHFVPELSSVMEQLPQQAVPGGASPEELQELIKALQAVAQLTN